MVFEAVLMTFEEKTDGQRAYESFIKANDYTKRIQRGQHFSDEKLREIMKLWLDVFWVYDELRSGISTNIHSIGKMLRHRNACILEFDKDNNSYASSCPAMLLHLDFGFSIRALEKYKCSICGKPIIDCEHITNDLYDNVECMVIEGTCNICGKPECKDHVIGKKYNHVQACKIPYDVKLITFDLVKDPEDKYARVNKVYFKKEMIDPYLPDEQREGFRYGVTELNCDHCLICDGYHPKVFDDLFQRG